MRPIVFLPLSVIWLCLPGCGKKAAAKPPAPPPAAVTFVPASTETVTVTRDLPGRVGPVRVSEVRARVPGILLEKTFTEGADVKAGDVLFRIDPAPLEAARNSAAAALAQSEASEKIAKIQSDRLTGLIKLNAVSKQEFDNSESSLSIATAEVQAAKAALATADLNLGYATVTAPISGRIGKAVVTEGALVGQGDATLMAVIQQLDPVYFDFTQTSVNVLAFRRAAAAAGMPKNKELHLLLEDGSTYEKTGKLLFSEVSVDQTTGMVTLRAEFPNPDYMLLPGMFARGRIVQTVLENVVTVPQRAVTRGLGGSGTVMIIDESKTAQIRTVQTGEISGDKWVITSGLKAGEHVIIEGQMKAKPGSPVAPEPFQEKKPVTTGAAPASKS